MSGRHRLGMVLVCLHISTVIYILIAAGFWVLATRSPIESNSPESERFMFGVVALSCLLFAIVPEIAALGLRRRRFWGWVLSLILFGLYAPSLFLPLGVLGLWGLLDAGSRAEMGIGVPLGASI